MAKKTKTNFISSLFCLILGFIIGFVAITYFKLPQTEAVTVTEEIFYSKQEPTLNANIPLNEANISVHFLELGNKYTGDCTYIKTDSCDILIDCGSKSNSIPYITSYLNQYITDGTLEYVIITHAHQDHYAGFATSANVDSIFDLYTCQNIITFSQTNQKSTSTLYNNYLRELNEEISNGANYYTAKDCIEQTNGAQKIYNIGNNITMEVLDCKYYYEENKSSTENNYSVCTLITYNQTSNSQVNMLFTGDLEEDGEASLVSLNPSLPQVDLYKAGHHGSKTSSSEVLMQKIQPKTVCVCCCAGSPEYTKTKENQFPTQDFINRIAPYTNDIYVTTLCVDYANNLFSSFNGNIIFICSNLGYTIKCSNNDTILKNTTWFKENRTWP